jgi:hypothetical protein
MSEGRRMVLVLCALWTVFFVVIHILEEIVR